MGLTILKTPVRSPQANAFCERLIATVRRECLDWMIPLNENHSTCKAGPEMYVSKTREGGST